MPPPKDLRPFITRLLAGERRPAELMRIFAWLRFETRGEAPLLRDIAHFVAHRDQRDVGVAWQKASDFIWMTRWNLGSREGLRDLEAFKNSALSVLRSEGNAETYAKWRRSPKKVKRDLESALTTVVEIRDRKPTLSREISYQEGAILRHYTSIIYPHQPIVANEFVEQMYSCLVRIGLILETERDSFIKIADFLCVFVASQMHLSNIVDKDRDIGVLHIGFGGDAIEINIVSEVEGGDVLATIFQTQSHVEDWVDPYLLENRYKTLNHPVEFSDTWRLRLVL